MVPCSRAWTQYGTAVDVIDAEYVVDVENVDNMEDVVNAKMQIK